MFGYRYPDKTVKSVRKSDDAWRDDNDKDANGKTLVIKACRQSR